MNALGTRLGTLRSLGARNLVRVARYRLALRNPISPVRRIAAKLPHGPFFRNCCAPPPPSPPGSAWSGSALYFGWYPVPIGAGAPDWMTNPFTGERVAASEREWWRLPDFDTSLGDVKTVWEASRFDWALAMAQRARAGNGAELRRLNAWVESWCASNPAYSGPNWKCGQEASIRVLHLATASLILGQATEPEPGLVDLIRAHLARIEPTMGYALAQDNNHGTSEAAALFIGGSLLRAAKFHDRSQSARWSAMGRKWLEERVGRLVADDGSFSQHSVVYHRVLLDTLSIAEAWRRHLGLEPFSAAFSARARAAALWLRSFTQSGDGDAPNIGANDGARLIPLSDSHTRDFRPSAQLGCNLFASARAFPTEGSWDHPLGWLGLPSATDALPEETDRLLDEGGYAILRRGDAVAYLRYPRFRFRPAQADALHLDLWVRGSNVLRDAGTFSYNAAAKWMAYFAGTSAHNTVEFDGRDQMPRMGRFLFGAWLETKNRPRLDCGPDFSSIEAGYSDGEKCAHTRRVTLGKGSMVVEDAISGFARKAILRWRLAPGNWQANASEFACGEFGFSISASMPIVRMALTDGWESRHYHKRDPVPVVEAEVTGPGVLRTEFRWAA